MNVEEFVASTLEQIVRGVCRAQEAVHAFHGRVSPPVTSGPAGRLDQDTGTVVEDVQFDIAVTVSEAEKTKAGLMVAMGVVGGGTAAGSESQQAAVSRIKFSVPVALPAHTTTVNEADANRHRTAGREA